MSTIYESGRNPLTGHLVDVSCTQSRNRNNYVWYEVEPRREACGNARTINQTHVTYSNSIYFYALYNDSLHAPVNLPFSCVYPLELDAKVNADLRPLLPTGGIVGLGSASDSLMLLYQNANFSSPFPRGSVNLPTSQPLYVEVYVQENDLDFVTVLDDCYTTYTTNPQDPMRHTFIHNKCSVDSRMVTVVESGTSLRARFVALFFAPLDQVLKVYLHCHVNLCSPGPCVPDCSGRARRSVSEGVTMKSVSVGPITWGN